MEGFSPDSENQKLDYVYSCATIEEVNEYLRANFELHAWAGEVSEVRFEKDPLAHKDEDTLRVAHLEVDKYYIDVESDGNDGYLVCVTGNTYGLEHI